MEGVEDSSGYQSCLNILLLALICITCPFSLPLLAACWCCQNACLMGESCLGEGMGEAAETALIWPSHDLLTMPDALFYHLMHILYHYYYYSRLYWMVGIYYTLGVWKRSTITKPSGVHLLLVLLNDKGSIAYCCLQLVVYTEQDGAK